MHMREKTEKECMSAPKWGREQGVERRDKRALKDRWRGPQRGREHSSTLQTPSS